MQRKPAAYIGGILVVFIASLFLEFAITTEPVVRPADAMLYNSKYLRLRLFREEGAAQFQAANAATIGSCAVLLRHELAKSGNRHLKESGRP